MALQLTENQLLAFGYSKELFFFAVGGGEDEDDIIIYSKPDSDMVITIKDGLVYKANRSQISYVTAFDYTTLVDDISEL